MTGGKTSVTCSISSLGHVYHHVIATLLTVFLFPCVRWPQRQWNSHRGELWNCHPCFTTVKIFSKDNCRVQKNWLPDRTPWIQAFIPTIDSYFVKSVSFGYFLTSKIVIAIPISQFVFWELSYVIFFSELGTPIRSMTLIQRVIHLKHILPNGHQVPTKCHLHFA